MGRMPRFRGRTVGLFVVIVVGLALVAAIGTGRVQVDSAAATATAATSPTAPSTPIATDATATPTQATPAPLPSADTASPAPVADGVIPGSVNVTGMNLTAEYQATVVLSFATRSFVVGTTIGLTNTSGEPIDHLELNTIAARLGQMSIRSASVDGRAVHPTFSDQTVHLPLGGILPAGARAVVRLTYKATLRSDTSGSNWLFTRANGILEAHRWLPWISKPLAFSRPNHGDPFVTGVSPRVRVSITSDRVLQYAATGEATGGSGLTRTFEAHNVRDFAFTAAPDYAFQGATVDGVQIRVWSRPGFPGAPVLAAAKTALAREAALLGPYPYPTYEVAQTAGGFGMESPGLTWIPTGAGSLPYLVAHETAHQWFYGIVGSDQANQPYADEAAADFTARYALGLRRASSCATARLDLSIYRYSSACYYEVVYIQGGNFLDDLRRTMGPSAFWAGVHDYLAKYRFRMATTKNLLDTLDAHTPLNLVPRYHPRFPGNY